MTTATTSSSPKPALTPPPGQTSNFENPPTLTGVMHIAMGVSIPLTTIFFLTRTYVRIRIKRQWVAEDWLALIAWIGTISFCGVGAATMAHHGGEHEWDITVAQAKEAAYWFNVASIHYGITICIAKLAVLFLYRRVFSPSPRSPFDITCIFLIVLLILFYIAINLVKIWECIPREKIWDSSIPGHCIDTSMLLNVSGIFNTVTDFIIVLMPVRAVWSLNMAFKKKVTVVLAFTFGLCAPAFSLVGTIVRIQGTNDPDKTWVQPDIIMWGLAELTTGVLCVSFPEMGVLLKKRTWSRSKGPSTSIVKGRYRQEDAVYQGPSDRHKWFTTSISQGTTLAADQTIRSKADNDRNPYVELDEVRLIDGHRSAVNQDSQGAHEHPQWPPAGDVGVTCEVRVDSNTVE